MKLLGDLLMCAMIIGGIVVFVRANANYMPEQKKEESNEKNNSEESKR